jgi:hypothetical protein
MGSAKFKYSRGDENEIGRAKGHSKRYIGDSKIAEHAGAQRHQLARGASHMKVARNLGHISRNSKVAHEAHDG